MDIRKVKKLIEMLEDSSLEEIEIQEGEESVRLVKGSGSRQTIQPQSIVIPQELPLKRMQSLNQFRKNQMIVIPLILRWLEHFMPLLHLAQNRLYL
ncbi:MAG: hypothetical protein CM15mP86_14210 [Gammaproteobacteria bacterium]|nr:MAG: hypothetical protein CM15mP86_14210 [Gammaproteobacteria bacterium]